MEDGDMRDLVERTIDAGGRIGPVVKGARAGRCRRSSIIRSIGRNSPTA